MMNGQNEMKIIFLANRLKVKIIIIIVITMEIESILDILCLIFINKYNTKSNIPIIFTADLFQE